MEIIRHEFWEGIGRNVAIGRCSCGAEVALYRFTNECPKCGKLYNMSGQELSNPSNWGEGTGEYPEDCL